MMHSSTLNSSQATSTDDKTLLLLTFGYTKLIQLFLDKTIINQTLIQNQTPSSSNLNPSPAIAFLAQYTPESTSASGSSSTSPNIPQQHSLKEKDNVDFLICRIKNTNVDTSAAPSSTNNMDLTQATPKTTLIKQLKEEKEQMQEAIKLTCTTNDIFLLLAFVEKIALKLYPEEIVVFFRRVISENKISAPSASVEQLLIFNKIIEILNTVFNAHTNLSSLTLSHQNADEIFAPLTPARNDTTWGNASDEHVAITASALQTYGVLNQHTNSQQKARLTDMAIIIDLTALRIEQDHGIFRDHLPSLWNNFCQPQITSFLSTLPQNFTLTGLDIMNTFTHFIETIYATHHQSCLRQDMTSTAMGHQICTKNFLQLIACKIKEQVKSTSIDKMTRLLEFIDAALVSKQTPINPNNADLQLIRNFWLSPELEGFLYHCRKIKEPTTDTQKILYLTQQFISVMQDITLNCLANKDIQGAKIALHAVLQNPCLINLQHESISSNLNFMSENPYEVLKRKSIFDFFKRMQEKSSLLTLNTSKKAIEISLQINVIGTFLRYLTRIMSQVAGKIDPSITPSNPQLYANFQIASKTIRTCLNILRTPADKPLDMISTKTILLDCRNSVETCLLSSGVTNLENQDITPLSHVLGMLLIYQSSYSSFTLQPYDPYAYIPKPKSQDEWVKIEQLNNLASNPVNSTSTLSSPPPSIASTLTINHSFTPNITQSLTQLITELQKAPNHSQKDITDLCNLHFFWSSNDLNNFLQYCRTTTELNDNFSLSANFITDFIFKMCDFSIKCLALHEISAAYNALNLILQHPCLLKLHSDMKHKRFGRHNVMQNAKDIDLRHKTKDFLDKISSRLNLEAIYRIDSTNVVITEQNLLLESIIISRFLCNASSMLYSTANKAEIQNSQTHITEIRESFGFLQIYIAQLKNYHSSQDKKVFLEHILQTSQILAKNPLFTSSNSFSFVNGMLAGISHNRFFHPNQAALSNQYDESFTATAIIPAFHSDPTQLPISRPIAISGANTSSSQPISTSQSTSTLSYHNQASYFIAPHPQTAIEVLPPVMHLSDKEASAITQAKENSINDFLHMGNHTLVEVSHRLQIDAINRGEPIITTRSSSSEPVPSNHVSPATSPPVPVPVKKNILPTPSLPDNDTSIPPPPPLPTSSHEPTHSLIKTAQNSGGDTLTSQPTSSNYANNATFKRKPRSLFEEIRARRKPSLEPFPEEQPPPYSIKILQVSTFKSDSRIAQPERNIFKILYITKNEEFYISYFNNTNPSSNIITKAPDNLFQHIKKIFCTFDNTYKGLLALKTPPTDARKKSAHIEKMNRLYKLLCGTIDSTNPSLQVNDCQINWEGPAPANPPPAASPPAASSSAPPPSAPHP
ncbi:MAG: hypothetical protein A2X78_04515 [Gammaproteobacteria bacterium GWE2_37_16]|nr:MAG: hypothetical protein A2X78_04515 [Gammaproteobacteria bacterium GWE2_37_16]